MKLLRIGGILISAVLAAMYSPASAGEADVVAVEVTRLAAGVWRFDVTVRHADAGWDHYADRWEVMSPDDDVLATRVLLHPHDNEQPFTRSLPRVEVPEGLRRIAVRAHDSVHGYGGAVMTVRLPD